MLLHVRFGKGAKYCYVPLPERTLVFLRNYWVIPGHPKLVFPSRNARNAAQPISPRSVQQAFKAALKESGIEKQVSVPMLPLLLRRQ